VETEDSQALSRFNRLIGGVQRQDKHTVIVIRSFSLKHVSDSL